MKAKEKFELTEYAMVVVIFACIHYIMVKVPIVRSHVLMKVILGVTLVTSILKAMYYDLETVHFMFDGFIIFYFMVLIMIAHRIELVYIIHGMLLLMFGFYTNNTVRSYATIQKTDLAFKYIVV